MRIERKSRNYGNKRKKENWSAWSVAYGHRLHRRLRHLWNPAYGNRRIWYRGHLGIAGCCLCCGTSLFISDVHKCSNSIQRIPVHVGDQADSSLRWCIRIPVVDFDADYGIPVRHAFRHVFYAAFPGVCYQRYDSGSGAFGSIYNRCLVWK